MKIEIDMQDVVALYNWAPSFKDGYNNAIKGELPPLPNADDGWQALQRIGNIVARELLRVSKESIRED